MKLSDIFNEEIENISNEQINKIIDKYIEYIKNLVKTTNKTNEKRHKNKLNENKHWTVATRKDKEAVEDFYLNQNEDKVDAVGICAYHVRYKKLVIIKQFRVPINDYIYEVPAGLVDKGDKDILESVKRELKEETGLDLLDVNNDYTIEKTYLSPGMTDESIALVFCTCDGELNKDGLEDDEDIEAILVSQEEARKILKSKEKMDVKAFLMLQNFVLLGEKMFV